MSTVVQFTPKSLQLSGVTQGYDPDGKECFGIRAHHVRFHLESFIPKYIAEVGPAALLLDAATCHLDAIDGVRTGRLFPGLQIGIVNNNINVIDRGLQDDLTASLDGLFDAALEQMPLPLKSRLSAQQIALHAVAAALHECVSAVCPSPVSSLTGLYRSVEDMLLQR